MVSAIGTIAAAVIALFLPFVSSRKEWKRQDRFRVEDQKRVEDEWARQDKIRVADELRIKKDRTDVIHEVTSTVDRILAYRTSAIAIFSVDNVYVIGNDAIARINENTKTLFRMLELLEVRSGLTDGALYVTLSAKRLARAVIEQTTAVESRSNPDWSFKIKCLNDQEQLAAMVIKRNRKVRLYAGLTERSGKADEICEKYTSLANKIETARLADLGAPNVDITEDYY
jgi:hypothetical protein